MSTPPTGPTKAFTELVRDALLHLYEPAHLQAHPLVAMSDTGEATTVAPGRRLRQKIVDAIEALHPEDGTPASSRAWRTYRILELRYIEGQDSTSVAESVYLSRAQYHREHQRALQAVSLQLWEQWHLVERWSFLCDDAAPLPHPDVLTQHEAEMLHAEAGDDRVDPVEACHSVARLLKRLYHTRSATLQVTLPAHLPLLHGGRVALRQSLLGILSHALDTAGVGVVQLTGAQQHDHIALQISGPWHGPLASIEAGIAEIRPFVDSLHGAVSYQPPAADVSWMVTLTFPVREQRVLLVVDNSADFILLIDRYLSSHGWLVVGANDIDQAASVARQRHPHAIILDIVLPDRDGWELLEELKARPTTRDIPVVICSVLDEPAVALSLGAAAYLRKPVDEQHLVQMLTVLC